MTTTEAERIEARLAAAWKELGAAIEEWREYLKPTDEEMDEASEFVYAQYADMKPSEHVGGVDWDANVLETVEDLRQEKLLTEPEPEPKTFDDALWDAAGPNPLRRNDG